MIFIRFFVQQLSLNWTLEICVALTAPDAAVSMSELNSSVLPCSIISWICTFENMMLYYKLIYIQCSYAQFGLLDARLHRHLRVKWYINLWKPPTYISVNITFVSFWRLGCSTQWEWVPSVSNIVQDVLCPLHVTAVQKIQLVVESPKM